MALLSNPAVEYRGFLAGVAGSEDNARVVRENGRVMAANGDESQTC